MVREIKRKIFHFLSLVYALTYHFLGREETLKILVPILILEGIIEFGRLYFPAVNLKIIGLFGGIHREEETRRAFGLFLKLQKYYPMILFLRP